MAWATAKGFDFRATLGYVSDPANTQAVLGEAYPQTTTIGGDSVTWGWEQATDGDRDRDNTIDVRLAGMSFRGNNVGTPITFRVDLPASGSYTLRAAFGDIVNAQREVVVIQDTSSVIASLDSGSALDGCMDATGVQRNTGSNPAAWSADWVANNASRTDTYATTIFRVLIGQNGADATATCLSHLQLTQNAAATGFGPLLGMQRNRLVLAGD